MVIFSNDRINEMTPAELAMLRSLGGLAVRDEGAEQHQAIKEFIEKRRQQEDNDADYRQRLEQKFV